MNPIWEPGLCHSENKNKEDWRIEGLGAGQLRRCSGLGLGKLELTEETQKP